MSTRAARESRLAKVGACHGTEHRRRCRRLAVITVSLIAVAAVVAGMLLTSRPASRALARKAPDFTLSDTDGQVVRLEQFRGINVLLSFNAGAGCQPCLVQLAQIEKNARSRTGKSPSCPSVINDSGGQHRSFGEYPSMWLSVSDLLAQVNEHRST